ncbi:chemotaxis protein CheW [Ramlibacter algicola]|uniref:Chemotaxis protein CheW n=1 Tax=Ramlibacter algicola TaxID=2795217 RepID=A0A934Q481_9BURK|nr:chemotaxis protein CheW [Ramlibacter algicola]
MKQRATTAANDLASVLHARALALAQREEPVQHGVSIELLEFRLARDRYAIETRHVQEVLPLGDLTPVPCTPSFVAGVANVRGRITTVIDIRKFFGLPAQGLADVHHAVLVRSGDLELGVLAGAIAGVRTEQRGHLQPAVLPPDGVSGDYVMGMAADRLLVLDLPRMLADPRMIVNEEVNP